MIRTLIILAGAYLLGSISWGVLFGRLSGVDLTQVGSGSTGGTNAIRALGPVKGVLVGVLDIVKASAAVWIAGMLTTEPAVPVLAGVVAVLGHNHSIFLRFRGGKGIASTVGVYLVLAPVAALFAIPVVLMIIFLSRMVSLGSLTFVVLVPLFLLASGEQGVLITAGVLLAILAFIRHAGNIRRLREGTERRLGEKG